MKNEIEAMQGYIDRTPKGAEKTDMTWTQAGALLDMVRDTGAFDALSLAFRYGRAKGYRAAKREGRRADA